MRPALLSLLFLAITALQAQHSTLRFQDQPFALEHQSILVVPFQGKMYLSDVNHEIAEHNQINTAQIINQFSNALDQSIYYAFRKRCTVNSFRNLSDDSTYAELGYIYRNLDLEYELVSKDQSKKSGLQKFSKKLKKKSNDQYDRGGLENGQVVTKSDPRERYMKALVKDQKMLDSIHMIFNNRFFLFLNELDFKNNYEDALAMQNMDYQRELKVHFTLYNKEGDIMATGISRTEVPSNENNINVITSEYFPILAQNIYEALFDEESEETSETKLKLPWK